MKFNLLIVIIFGLYAGLFDPEFVYSQNSNAQGSTESDVGDSGTRRPLPGEEVTTPGGQKMRVWSTEGPVPVSQAPQPFEDPEKTILPSGVIVDAEVNRGKVPNRVNESK